MKNKKISISINFQDNKLIGKFIFSQDENYLIEGQFDNSGLFDGTWIIRWNGGKEDFENIRQYDSGELKMMVERNISTGDILFRDDTYHGEGLKIMTNAIEFWISMTQPTDYCRKTISDRNYMYLFDRGIIQPENPFQIVYQIEENEKKKEQKENNNE